MNELNEVKADWVVNILNFLNSRRKAAVAVLLACTALALWESPEILARTRLRHIIEQQLLPAHSAQLEIAAVSAGWCSPITAHGVQYRTRDWELKIASIETNRTLLDLLWNYRDLGDVQVDQPHLLILTRPETERASVHKRGRSRQSGANAASKQRMSPTIHLVGAAGEIAMLGPADRRMPLVHHVEFDVASGPAGESANFKILARTGQPDETAHLQSHGSVRWPPRPFAGSVKDLVVEFTAVDATALDPLLELTDLPITTEATNRRGAAVQLLGRLSGSASFRVADRPVNVEANLELTECEFATAGGEFSIREPVLTVSGVGRWDNQTLVIDAARVAAESITCEGSGTISDWDGSRDASLDGNLTVDWTVLTDRLNLKTTAGMAATGRSRRSWHMAGSLRPGTSEIREPLQFDAGIAADSVEWSGLETGPVDLSAHWEHDTVRLERVITSIQHGRLSIQPEVQFGPAGPILRMAPGRVLENVALDRALCDRILRYLDPLATLSSDLHGKVSVDLETCEIPVSRDGLERATISGRVFLDDIEFHAGESLQELLAAAGVQFPSHLRSSQQIDVRLENGRVNHSGLAVPLHDQAITLDGWVGIDHTIQVCLSLPVTEQMLGRDKRLHRLLRGQRIDVPITGTLEHPRVNEEALSRNLQRLVQSAVRDSVMRKLK